LISFIKGEFSLIVNDIEYYFVNLDSDLSQKFLSFWFRTNIIYEYYDKLIPDDDKIRWFEMINFAGTPHDIEHLKKLKK
jgi:hypothetical protein